MKRRKNDEKSNDIDCEKFQTSLRKTYKSNEQIFKNLGNLSTSSTESSK